MLCAVCQIADVWPESLAGLCVSCREAFRRGDYVPAWDELGLYISISRANPERPLGADIDCHVEYLPSVEDSSTLSLMIEELVNLNRPIHRPRLARAELVIRAIRELGLEIRFNTGMGHSDINRPGRVPYPLLVEYVDVLTEVDDVLLRERAEELGYAAEVNRLLAERLGEGAGDGAGNDDTQRDGRTVSGQREGVCGVIRLDGLSPTG